MFDDNDPNCSKKFFIIKLLQALLMFIKLP